MPSVFHANAGSISELSVSDEAASLGLNVTQFIEAMQAAQYTQLFRSARNQSKVLTSEINAGKVNLNNLYQDIKTDTESGTPIILTLCQSQGGSALLAYKVKEISGTVSHVYVYDSSYPREDRYVTFEKNGSGDWASWSYDMNGSGVWGTEKSDSYISAVAYSVVEGIWEGRGKLEENENVAFINAKDVAIYDSNNKLMAMIHDGQLISAEPGFYMMDDELTGESSGEKSGIALAMPIDTYRFQNLDASVEQFEISMFDTNLGADVSTTAREIILSVDDSNNLNAVRIQAAADDTYSVTLHSSYPYDKETVTVEGKGNGGLLEISQSKGELKIDNCQVESLTVDGEKAALHKISSQASSGGSISPAGEQAVPTGEDITYRIEPAAGYKIKDVKIDGESIGVVDTYTFKDVRASHTISAIFEKIQQMGTPVPGGTGGTVTNPNGAQGNGKKTNTIEASNITKTYAKSQKFSLGAKAGDGAKLSYKSSNNKVAQVSSEGVVTVKGVGKATITITAASTDAYDSATKKITVTVKPKGTSVSKLQKSRKAFTVKWKKQTTQTTGYQIQYSTNSKFKKGKKTVTIKKNKTTSKKIGKLKAKKKYYVRVRTYKTVGKIKYYSSWSKAKSVKVK